MKSYGKHLLIYTDIGLGIRTHLGMPGRVESLSAGSARGTNRPGRPGSSSGWRAPRRSASRRPTSRWTGLLGLEAGLAEWGPDLADPEFDLAEAIRRAPPPPRDRTAADLILDQRVAAGAGNVYKSEVLFLERVHPEPTRCRTSGDGVRRILGRRPPASPAQPGSGRPGDNGRFQTWPRAVGVRPGRAAVPPVRNRHRDGSARRPRSPDVLVPELSADHDPSERS